jgi:aldehyde dehydrogenase (NAD+)
VGTTNPIVEIDPEVHRRIAATQLPDTRPVIGGERIADASAAVYEHVNATTGEVQGSVGLGSAREIDAAVEAARDAQRVWWGMRPDQRRDALLRLAGLIRRDAGRLGQMVTLECGAAASTSTALPSRSADYLEYFAGLADKMEGRVIPIFPEQAFDYTLPEPYGVVACISTWNGGISALGRKAGAALAAGNAVVVKPMELAPFTAVAFADLVAEAELPAGLVNVVPGGADAGDALVRNPGVDKITFTGGAAVGKKIMATAAENLTPVVLELGGKSANIVFPDADLDVAGIFVGTGCMRMAGQGCNFPTRAIVHTSIADELTERAIAAAQALTIGDPMKLETVVGPVVSEAHCARILGMIDEARSDSSLTLLTGGDRVDGPLSNGFFIEPTIFAARDGSARIYREEVFGPVLVIRTFETEDEALAMANETSYGLAAYVQTQDLRRAHRMAARLEAGYISLNGFAALPASAPFGGNKMSGIGREAGREGFEEFVRAKNVYLPM